MSSTTVGVPAIVLHIPHSSTVIPNDVRGSLILSDEALALELLRMTDAFTEELFDLGPSLAEKVVFPVSRLVVDPERFRDDEKEPMAKKGMGAVYVSTSDGQRLRGESFVPTRESLMQVYYEPHHRLLEHAVLASLETRGTCLLIDCHSFRSLPLPHEFDKAPDRPDICIGTDDFHTPSNLTAECLEIFHEAGFTTKLNSPFTGALVPTLFYRRDPRVRAVMVEVNRALYLDEDTGQKRMVFDPLRLQFQKALEALVKQQSRCL